MQVPEGGGPKAVPVIVGDGAPYIKLKMMPPRLLASALYVRSTMYHMASVAMHWDDGDHVAGRVGKTVVDMAVVRCP